MGNTGAPYNIPYLESSTLLRDIPAADEAQAVAVAAALDAAGGLVAVHYAETTAPLSFGSVPSGGNASITGLSLNGLALSDASNKFLINCTAGQVHNSTGYPEAGLAVAANGTLLTIGNASGIKARVTSGPITRGHDLTQTNNRAEVSTLNILFAPGDTTARNFTARIINLSTFTSTMFVNRTRTDANDVRHTRAASTLTIMEVRG